ncbi:hypothetical protein ACWGOQ_0019890 [Aquimarina sp. M1]
MDTNIFNQLYTQSCNLYTIGRIIETNSYSTLLTSIRMKLVYYGETIVQKLRNYFDAPDIDIKTVALSTPYFDTPFKYSEKYLIRTIRHIVYKFNDIIRTKFVPTSIRNLVIQLTNYCSNHFKIPKQLSSSVKSMKNEYAN